MIAASGRVHRRITPIKTSIVVVAVAVAASCCFAASASAVKQVDSVIGGAPATGDNAFGGLFSDPRGIAVNTTGAGGVPAGTFYVVEQNNNRVQQFSPSSQFVRAWGFDVIRSAGSPPNSNGTGFEICDATAPTPNTAAQCKNGTSGTAAGQLSSPRGIAVDQATGNVYITTASSSRRVNVFGPAGVFHGAFGWGVDTGAAAFEFCTLASTCVNANTAGANGGQFGQPSATHMMGIAVAPAGSPTVGHVFAADPVNRRLMEFSVTLGAGDVVTGASFVKTVGWNVDALGGGGALESCVSTVLNACQAGVAGAGAGQFANAASPGTDIGIDATGAVYAIDSGNNRVQKFDAAMASAADFAPGELSGVPSPETVAVTPSNGHVFVSKPSSAPADWRIKELDTAGTLLQTHMVGANDLQIAVESLRLNGLAVSPVGGRMYASISQSAVGQLVFVLDDDGSPAASAEVQPPSNVGSSSATLSGVVNPNGTEAKYHFEVSLTGVDGEWTPVGPDQTAGSGNVEVDVSQAATGLLANRLYRVRLVVKKAFGGPTTVSPEVVMLTDAPKPDVATGAVQQRSATSAQLLGTVNPNSQPTTYRFEYGRTAAYGNTVPAPDGDAGSGGVGRPVLEQIEGLEPGKAYHYRLVATNAQGTAFGIDKTFTTRTLPSVAPPAGRAFEMVTPADKNNRRGGGTGALDDTQVATGVPAPDGDSVLVRLPFGILDANGGTAFPHARDNMVIARGDADDDGTADGWYGQPTVNIASETSAAASLDDLTGLSADLKTQAWWHEAQLFPKPNGSDLGTRIFGDHGGLHDSGWYDWIDDPTMAVQFEANGGAQDDNALIDDSGQRMLRWGEFAGLLGPTSAEDPSRLQTSGYALYSQEPPGSGPQTLINGCTGAGATSTELPTRDDNNTPVGLGQFIGQVSTTSGSTTITVVTANIGAPAVGQRVTNSPGGSIPAGARIDSVGAGTFTVSIPATASASGIFGSGGDTAQQGDDTVGARPCGDGSITSVRGAVAGVGGVPTGTFAGMTATNAMSDDGNRVFFTAPDPVTAPTSCAGGAATGPLTDCPPQVFVRQLDSSGDPTVRWISRPASPGTPIALLGQTVYEGASSDGQTVYFRTNSRLVPNDPNGGSATALSAASWDLYRYQLPESNDDDPAGGDLTRITGGNGGTADPNTNDIGGGKGSASRFVSDDGERVYFVTNAKLPDVDADNSLPDGGKTSPGGVAAQNASRNLYLYDDSETGSQRWQFIAQIPYGSGDGSLNSCASSGSQAEYPQFAIQNPSSRGIARKGSANCVRGTRDGRYIVFESGAQLTDDDVDSAGDIYVYDADAGDHGELTRISAPPITSAPYECDVTSHVTCNADLGFGRVGESVGLSGARHANLAMEEGQLTVYFESKASLVSEDTNGGHMDTYRWRAGELSLISPGNTDDNAYYSGNTPDGDDVFIFTTQRIDGREVEDGDFDIYDVRRGGGLPLPSAAPRCDPLTEGSCREAGRGAGSRSQDSAQSGGGSNAAPTTRKLLAVSVPSKAQLARAARNGVLALRVRASQPGRVKAAVRAKIGKRMRTFGSTSRRFSKAGVATLRVRFGLALRQRLKDGRPVRIKVVVSSGNARTKTLGATLKRGRR